MTLPSEAPALPPQEKTYLPLSMEILSSISHTNSYITEIEKQRPIQRRIRELVLYYISAGQTSLLQVGDELLIVLYYAWATCE